MNRQQTNGSKNVCLFYEKHYNSYQEHIRVLCVPADMEQPNTSCLNTLRQRQNGRHFPDDIFRCIFLNENVWISINISLKFVLKGPINKIPALVQIMAWHHPRDKPLSEPMMVSLPIHICVTWPQWVRVKVLIFTLISRVGIVYIFVKFPSVNAMRHPWWLVNIGSGNGLVPSGNKPLPAPMLT